MQNETVTDYILRTFESVAEGVTIESLALEMLRWPPDLFFITSLLFKKTGIYIYIMSPPYNMQFPGQPDWQEMLRDIRDEWYTWIWEDGAEVPADPNLADYMDDLNKCLTLNVTVSQLRDFAYSDSLQVETEDEDDERWQWCRILLQLHALADEICAGFGIPSGDYWTKDNVFDPDRKIIHFIANSLLTYTGSLSRFPSHLGVVLPKMRTPNVGMTVRSISHYLTFHHTEVVVNWRTLPWVNIDENTVNILVVPYPYEVKASDFQPSPAVTNRANREDGRYFVYRGGDEEFTIELLDTMLNEIEKTVNRVHLIVFPEQALTEGERDKILYYLTHRYSQHYKSNSGANQEAKNRTQLPMVLSGIRHNQTKPFSAHAKDFKHNRLVLSTFFAGKWYQTEQPKHHRWRLDRSQIQQYGLGGVLAGNREWWEAIPYTQRKISVLAPNGWLALCPLICEDLARQEPVADVIRGIGPTLIIAILLDGPQLPARWSARYASALADDPGSSVLTVTSLGMTLRSKKYKGESFKEVSREIGLWRDMEEGFEKISIGEGQAGVLLNASAKWREELTADGRVDSKSSAMFIIDGKFQAGAINTNSKDTIVSESYFTEAVREQLLSKHNDLLEISVISYFIDAAFECIFTTEGMRIDLLEVLFRWVLPNSDYTDASPSKLRHSLLPILQRSYDKLYPDPGPMGLTAQTESEVRPYLKWFVDWMKECHENDVIKPSDNYETLLEEITRLLNYIRDEISDEDYFALIQGSNAAPQSHSIPALNTLRISFTKWYRCARIPVYISLALLWAIHKRLYTRLRDGQLDASTAETFNKVEQLLQKNHDEIWFSAINESAESLD